MTGVQTCALPILSLPGDAGPHSGIARLECAVLQSRIVAADRFVETRFAAFVEAVIEAVAPRKVRAEFAASAEIDGHMHAQPILPCDRIDQVIERRFPGQRVVMTDRVVAVRDCRGRNAFNGAADDGGAMAGGVA